MTWITSPLVAACYSERMNCLELDRVRRLAPMLALGLLVGCGPTPDNVAVTALTVMPFGLLFGVFGAIVVRRMWSEPALVPSAVWVLFGVGVMVSLLIVSSSIDFDAELLMPCAMFIVPAITGTSMLVARLRLSSPAERSVIAIPLVLTTLFAAPFWLVYSMTGPSEEPFAAFGVWAAFLAFAASPVIALGLLIEWLIRKPPKNQR